MKEIDRYSIETMKIPSIVLMERAALSVCGVMEQNMSKDQRIMAVCSMGNNGADGLCCARILWQRGYDTAICLVGNLDKATKEFRLQLEICANLGIPQVNMASIDEYDVIVDALFGIGLDRTIDGEYRRVIDRVNTAGKMVFAVDVPSGIHATNGRIMGCAIKADHTVTFGFAKSGLLFYPGAACTGRLHVMKDIGFVTDGIEQMQCAWSFEADSYKEYIPLRRPDSNKGTYGKVLVVAGSHNMAGAAYFSAAAAYRTGAGLVKVLTHSDNREIIMSRLPEAVMSFYDNMTEQEYHKEAAWADAVVIGPGIGQEPKSEWLTYELLSNETLKSGRQIVVDADALNICAAKKWHHLLKGTIITPHLGELSRLLGKEISDIKGNLMEEAVDFANAHDCICVMKDSTTVVSDGRECYINTTGNSGMATGGSGDVLTGIIAGLLGQKQTPYLSACLGVFLHGRCGDMAAEAQGEYGMMAGDIISHIGQAILG